MKNLKFLFTTILLFTTATYAQNYSWNDSISAVGEQDAVNFNSPAAMDKDGNLYVTGTQTEAFEFAGKDAEVLALGAYIAKYNAKGEELFAITLHGAIDITAITTDAENNFYVAGSFAGEAYITDVEGTDGEYEIISNSEENIKTAAFIAKYDANGNLLAVKSYIAEHNDFMKEMEANWMYWGMAPEVSISKIVADGPKVYAQFSYIGGVAIDENLTTEAKYIDYFGMCYLEFTSTSLVSFDSNIENASELAQLTIADTGDATTYVNSFNFVVDGDDVYVAAFGMGNLVLTTSAGADAFDFGYDGNGVTETGAILAKIGKKAVKFSNIPNEAYYGFDAINGIDVVNGNLYIAGTFGVTCAFDSTKVAVGASDVFVASVNAEELSVNWVYTNANDEGETNKFFEEVTGVVFDEENILVIDAVTDMNNEVAPVAKNYAVSYAGVAEETEAIAATAVAYNANAVAFINYTTATYITVYRLDGCVFSEEDGVYTLVMYNGNKTELVLPVNYNGMNYVIGANAFKGKTSITSIVIPNSVTSIGDYAFSGCSGLTSIEIPSSVTSIGRCAFRSCSGLTSIEIPNGVTSIGNNAFSNCSGLTSVTIPNSVTSIGSGAFCYCI